MRRVPRICAELVAAVVEAHVLLRGPNGSLEVFLEPGQPRAVRTLLLRLGEQLAGADAVLERLAERAGKSAVLRVYLVGEFLEGVLDAVPQLAPLPVVLYSSCR